jgi:hypothetical protein
MDSTTQIFREVADSAFEDGWNAAMNEVNKIAHESYANHEADIADTIFQRVWKRLDKQLAPALAALKARRAARDQYAAEIAARTTRTQS